MKNLSFILFLFTLCFAPLAFGTVEQWSLTFVELLICSSTVLYLFSQKVKKKKILKVPGLLPIGLLLLWMLVQIIPLPVSVVKILSPATYEVYRPIINLSGSNFIPLTVYQKGTLNELLRIGSYTLFFFLTVQLLSQKGKLQLTVKVIVWIAIGISFIAILQKFSSPYKVYWYRPGPVNGAYVFGPWINRSQYCGFMEMLGPLILALFFYYRPQVNYNETMRDKVVSFFTLPGSSYHLLLVTGFFLVCVSVFLSLGRGGIISLCLATMLFFAVLSVKEKYGFRLVSAFLAGGMILSVAWFGWKPIISRFSGILSTTGMIQDDRIDVWRDTVGLIKDFIGTGSGFGTYGTIFPSYKIFSDSKLYEHAHNDYIELLTDGGLIGFSLAAWFVIIIISLGWKMIQKRRDKYSALISIGALSGIVGMLLHSITDFNMHNGADGLYFFFMCGLLVSAGHTRIHYRSRSTLLNLASPGSKSLILLFAVLLFFTTIFIRFGQPYARYQYETVQNIELSESMGLDKINEVKEIVGIAAQYDPLEGLYPSILGDVEINVKDNSATALVHYLKAAELDPFNEDYLQQIGVLSFNQGSGAADQFMELSYRRALVKEYYFLALVDWYLSNGNRIKAIDILHEGILQDQPVIKDVIPILANHSFSREELALTLPPSMKAWIDYGLYLNKVKGSKDDVEFYLRKALGFLENEKDIQPRYFDSLYRFYHRQKRDDEAIEIIREAVSYLPDHAPFRILLGDYYFQRKIYYRAEEEYQHALLLEPSNDQIYNRLQKLEEQLNPLGIEQ